MTTIVYPAGAATAAEKTAFLYRLSEKLRLEHNEMGAKFRNKTISKIEWDTYLSKFNVKHKKMIDDLLAERDKLKNDDSWNIDLETALGP